MMRRSVLHLSCHVVQGIPRVPIVRMATRGLATRGGCERATQRKRVGNRRRKTSQKLQSTTAWLDAVRASGASTASSAQAAAPGHERALDPIAAAPRRANRLHLLFATPVLSQNLVEDGSVEPAFNHRLATLGIAEYNRFATDRWRGGTLEKKWEEDRGWLNDAFFEWQKMQWHSAGGWPKLYQDRDFQRLQELILDAASCLRTDTGHSLLHDNRLRQEHCESIDAGSGGRLQIWVGVHHDGTRHDAHVHKDVLFSGTYYAQAPAGASALVLYDPREPQPTRNDARGWRWHPQAGDLLLFPPWCCECAFPLKISDAVDTKAAISFVGTFANLCVYRPRCMSNNDPRLRRPGPLSAHEGSLLFQRAP
eukprot:SAG31_NODE_1566_length_7856_cov_8.045607_2_plen_366_part_00